MALLITLKQRCPTHSPLATCGEWPFERGEWLLYQIIQIFYVLNKIKFLETKLRLKNSFHPLPLQTLARYY